jgi:acyl-coenzyme A thioesterase PaaI-like protein
MDITLIPFNRLVGIGHSTVPGFLLELDASPSHANHLGGVHAGAQLALAEATSAEGLLRAFPDLASSSVPVVRRLESRFRRPAQGTLRSRASIAEEADRKFRADYSAKGRGLIEVNVEVVDAGGSVTLTATVEWFIQKRS